MFKTSVFVQKKDPCSFAYNVVMVYLVAQSQESKALNMITALDRPVLLVS